MKTKVYWKTYIEPAMIAINIGTPTPTLTPIMSLLLTPPVSPSMTPVIPDVGVLVGTKDVGVPLVDSRFLTFVPNAIVLATEFCVVAGHVAVDPDGTEVISVLVAVYFDVVCSDTGQLSRPVDRQPVPVYVVELMSVVVVKPVASTALAVNAALVEVVFARQELASVV